MTLLHFTFGALPYHDAKKGTHIIHCWLDQSEATRTDSPGDERRAAKDARHILDDIILRNINEDEERLLQDGEMPPSVTPVFTFALGVSWDRDAGLAAYKQIDYRTLSDDRRFSPVLALGGELYHYTFGVLRERERNERKAVGAAKFAFDRATLDRAKEAFAAFCERAVARHNAHLVNARRFDCPKLRNGYCSPSDQTCACYRNGRCVEVAV